MPLSDRDYIRGKHPSACTCVDCVNKRLRKRVHQRHNYLPRSANKHGRHFNLPPRIIDKQRSHIKREYPRDVRIISNIILSLVAILAIGLLGGGIYGVAKYHDNAWAWVFQQSRSLTETVSTFTDSIPNFFNTAKDKVVESGVVQTITDKLQEVTTPTPETIKPTTPTPITPKSSIAVSSLSVEEIERQAFDLINQERMKVGLQPTRWDDALYKLSKAHTEDMANKGILFHTPTGAGYGENAWGASWGGTSRSSLASKIVNSWMSSPLHRDWILHIPLTTSVVSIVDDSRGQYASWTFYMLGDGGPPLIKKAYNMWQAETGGSIPWLTWLGMKGYPYDTSWLVGE